MDQPCASRDLFEENKASVMYPAFLWRELTFLALMDIDPIKQPVVSISPAQQEVDALFNMGVRYLKGLGIQKNFELAFNHFKEAADKGDIIAQYNVGEMYFDGIGIKVDYKRAYPYLEKAAAAGHKQSRLMAGLLSLANKDCTLAFKYFYPLIQEKNLDPTRIFNLMLKPAEEGEESAQDVISRMYWEGLGVEKDILKSWYWYLLEGQTLGEVEQSLSDNKILLENV